MRHVARLTVLVALAAACSLTACAVAHGPQFQPGQQVGTVQQAAMNEASGLAASRANPGILWVHNDSGGSARVFAMNVQGTHLGIYSQPIYFFERIPVPGDLDGDGDADLDDLSVMVDVLLGTDTNPVHLAAAEVNDSGAADGADIKPFVNQFVGA